MGDPRRIKPKFRGPIHPWNKVRMAEEKPIKKEYGLKNKKEIWIAVSKLRRLNAQAKKLIRERGKNNKQAQIEEKQLMERLFNYNLVTENSTLENVLGLNIKNLLDRRLQTLVFKKGLSLTSTQARQFIIHGHILVNGKKVTIPGYSIARDEEFAITFNPKSTISKDDHPERAKKEKTKEKNIIKTKEGKEEVPKAEITEEELKKMEEMVGSVEV